MLSLIGALLLFAKKKGRSLVSDTGEFIGQLFNEHMQGQWLPYFLIASYPGSSPFYMEPNFVNL